MVALVYCDYRAKNRICTVSVHTACHTPDSQDNTFDSIARHWDL